MPKPEWLEKKEEEPKPRFWPLCIDCKHIGSPTGKTVHRGDKKCLIYTCTLNGSLCTRFSIMCKDFAYCADNVSREDLEHV